MNLQVRISPDLIDVAIRDNTEAYPWRCTNGEVYTDKQVAPWSPLASAGETTTSHEYELRHPSGKTDEFTDIGDAVDFQESQFPGSKLFHRTVTTTVVKTEWQPVDTEAGV